MSNDWTNKLRDHLTDYQEPVKDDLWAAIEQSLAQQGNVMESLGSPLEPNEEKTSQQNRTPVSVVKLRRFSMAAAIAALAIGGTYVYLHPWNEVKDAQVASVLESQSEAPLKSQKEATAKFQHGAKASMLPNVFSSTKIHNVSNDDNELLALSETASLDAEKQEPVSSQQSAPVMKKSADTSADEYNSNTHESAYNDLAMASYEPALGNSRRSHSESGWSLTIYGENGVAQKNNGNTGAPYMMSDATVANAPAYYGESVFLGSPVGVKQLKAVGNMDYTEEVKHHHPISAGVQLGYNLTKRLRLTTGVVYTYVSSDYVGASHGNRVETTQKLHYLGVPLNLNYGIWKTERFHTYITAGGEGDVNIKNHTETDGVETSSKRDRMQWSVNAAVGAQYDIIPQVGIYVEPGAKYYFDNGSQIENAFKDKKFNFNLQLGLRWNINK